MAKGNFDRLDLIVNMKLSNELETVIFLIAKLFDIDDTNISECLQELKKINSNQDLVSILDELPLLN